jgi:predicted permease
LRSRVPLDRIFSPSSWTGVWTSYAGFDESYANRSSFGFFVDVGNGFTTLIPSLVYLYGMTYELIPARALGIVGILLFYQMWYGTVVYLGSFFFNKRHAGHPIAHVAIIVGLLNGVWLTFPLVGMYASVYMVYTSSYSLFR